MTCIPFTFSTTTSCVCMCVGGGVDPPILFGKFKFPKFTQQITKNLLRTPSPFKNVLDPHMDLFL